MEKTKDAMRPLKLSKNRCQRSGDIALNRTRPMRGRMSVSSSLR